MKRKPPEAQLALQVEKLASAIREFNPEKIILFGSAARGDYTAESDLDVVVVMESDKNFFERTYEVMRRCRVDMPLDLLVYTPEEFESMVERQNPFICRVLKEGKLL
jgi:uncharacterized protein